MKRTFAFTGAAALAGMLAFSVGALAAKPTDPVGGGGGGGGGTETPDLGDLVILYRDASGVPNLTAPVMDEAGVNVVAGQCQQPLAFASDTCPADSEMWGECAVGNPPVVALDPITCAVLPQCATCTKEVDFGRTNVVRSPVSVLEQQLDDVIVNLSTADCITLDPAGRLVTSTVADGTVTSGAIDSPLQNLAIYWQLLQTGYLGAATAPIALPGADYLTTAARSLGAAADKTGTIGVDMVVYINQILGLSDLSETVLGAPICIKVREEVQGVVQLVDKCFLDYRTYAYDRTTNFGSLPNPAYIPADGPQYGWLEYMALYPDATTSSGDLLFQILQGPILTHVFGNEPGVTDGNIGGFAQAADDARAVIAFTHSQPIPLGYEAPLTCTASGETHYDVSISADSGLQVPVRMVAGTEGREFTLAVANAGPDEATGTVLLTATDTNGAPIPTFPRTFAFNTLAAGTGQSWTEGFSINYKTTVTWTATITAAFDVNAGNNSVTETTTVIGKGGGGR
jgi:hypothetical protein